MIDRRTLLYCIGAVAATPVLSIAAPATRKVAVAKPGESRFAYSSAQQAALSPCKLTSNDSAGMLSIFELKVPSRSGPVRHIHHREDEWLYVMNGQFRFEVGDEKLDLSPGASVWMPRGVAHVWANTSQSGGQLLMACQPGGFEKFFDELAKIPAADPAQITKVMAKYGMEYAGPPLLGPWRQQRGPST
jgi:mannose-6-phosphate isomerase-like protein (cupin superfamily)